MRSYLPIGQFAPYEHGGARARGHRRRSHGVGRVRAAPEDADGPACRRICRRQRRRNRYSDLIEAGIDIAIRTREHEPDSNIIVRCIGRIRRVLAASPSYLEGRGRPETPADLAHHEMLIYNLANDPYSLRLRRVNATQTVRIAPTLDSNDGQVIRRAALAGLAAAYGHLTRLRFGTLEAEVERHSCRGQASGLP